MATDELLEWCIEVHGGGRTNVGAGGFGPGWRGWLGRSNLISRSCRAHSWYRFGGASLIAEKVGSAPLWIKNGGCKTKGDMERNAIMKVEYSESLRTAHHDISSFNKAPGPKDAAQNRSRHALGLNEGPCCRLSLADLQQHDICAVVISTRYATLGCFYYLRPQ